MAVLLVVLFHAGVTVFSGGYIGVDVFFVISGFVITGVLLRERTATGRISILDFYARRFRRIVPAATLVLLITVFTTFLVLGVVSGNSTADDGRWAAAFLANFHFESIGTNYLTVLRPPSPLQNYWSLSVEEQFYIAYPSIFMLVASVKSRLSLRARLSICLGPIIVASYWFSIVQTASHPALAYFSPLTRAWELALGALVAIGTGWLRQVPSQIAAVVTWAGLAAIVYSAVAFNAQSAYPGSLVAIPVSGAALIIAGGVAIPRFGAESLLALDPLQWLGKLSYSLYLWHWPVLAIAAERVGKTNLPVGENLLLILVALTLSVVSYELVEDPIRNWRMPSMRGITAGIGLVLATVVVSSLLIVTPTETAATHRVIPAANVNEVLTRVAAATAITSVPKGVVPPLAAAVLDWGGNGESRLCWVSAEQDQEHICTLGDPRGSHLLVLYGDSHAIMWLPAFDAIAKTDHWRLVVLGKPSCPAELVTVANLPYYRKFGYPFVACDDWHRWALNWISQHAPDLLVITQEGPAIPRIPVFGSYNAPGANDAPPLLFFSSAQWATGLSSLFHSVANPGTRVIMLGNIPRLPQSGPACLSTHLADVQACSATTRSSVSPFNQVEKTTALANGVQYVDSVPWFCSNRCTAIIGNSDVYLDDLHVTASWALYLQRVLAQAMGLDPEPTQ